ncbi:substrate-binding domain-containing protein [Desulfosediminicola sp.]|uniref:substrate-binding domain-containing protein n=1 Tax=Desulfosediminicola sp. TaxID=2886825 RepID=UPI003AF2CACA
MRLRGYATVQGPHIARTQQPLRAWYLNLYSVEGIIMTGFPAPKIIVHSVLICIFSLMLCGYANGSKRGTVALVMKSLANPFFSQMAEGAGSKANELGVKLDTFGLERETDVEQQISIMEHLIALNYGAILLAPADSKRLIPVCKKAASRNIPVIIIDNPLHAPTMKDHGVELPFIGPDNYRGGLLIGNYVKDKLNSTGRVIILEGIFGVENSEKRKAGIVQALTDNSSIEIAAAAHGNWHTDVALSKITELLVVHQNIDAIICLNDAMAIGAMQAVDLLGLPPETLITGYDNTEIVRTELRNGRIHATIDHRPDLMGACGVEKAVSILQNKQSPPTTEITVELVSHESFGKKIAFSVSTTENAFFESLVASAKNAATLHGIHLTILDAHNLDAQQLVDINTALLQQIDLLILNPTNSEYIRSGLETAENKNIPIITVDRKVTEANVLCHIESDNTAGGRLAASYLANHLEGPGYIAEVEGIPGTSAALERGTGFNEELAKHPNLTVQTREVADFDREKAKDITLRLIDSKTTIDGIFAHNDDMILGVLDAYDEKGIVPPAVLIGFDGIPEAKAKVLTKRLSATIIQQPGKMGRLALQTAAGFFRQQPIPNTISIELNLFTQQSATTP